MSVGVSNLSGSAPAGSVTKLGYLHHLQDVDLNTFEENGMGNMARTGNVFWGPDFLAASGQRWPNGM